MQSAAPVEARNLERLAEDEEHLAEEIRITVLHETALLRARRGLAEGERAASAERGGQRGAARGAARLSAGGSAARRGASARRRRRGGAVGPLLCLVVRRHRLAVALVVEVASRELERL